jgi:hypothetical protein
METLKNRGIKKSVVPPAEIIKAANQQIQPFTP